MSLSRSIQRCYCKELVKTNEWTTKRTETTTTQELVKLLQQSAVEHLTAYRHLEMQQFSSIAIIVATDFEALYAYKLGDNQRCLQLSTQNVHTLLTHGVYMSNVLTDPAFIQLLDDDIVSLTALTLIVIPECRYVITHVTLSLYLMTQCQLKIPHLVTSLSQTIDYVDVAHRRLPSKRTLDQLILKLIERKIVKYISTLV